MAAIPIRMITRERNCLANGNLEDRMATRFDAHVTFLNLNELSPFLICMYFRDLIPIENNIFTRRSMISLK